MEFFLTKMEEGVGTYIEKVTITLINQIHKNPRLRVKTLWIINKANNKINLMINQAEIPTVIKIQWQKIVATRRRINSKKVKI